MSGFIAVGSFLISLFFDIALFALWARVALRYLKISSLNPFSSLIYTLTNPIVNLLYFLLRYRDAAKQRYDWPCFILIFLVNILKVVFLCLVLFQTLFPFIYILIYALADFIIQPCNLLFFALLIRVIMSYVNPLWNHPFADFLKALTQPLVLMGRKIFPNTAGFDFAPFIIMVALKAITLFISGSLPVRLL